MLRKISTFWLMVFGLMLTSAITLGLMAASAIQTTRQTVETEQISQLRSRTEVYSLAINERLRAFENATQLAAAQAKLLILSNSLSSEETQSRLQKYQRDTNNVYGLDSWYQTNYQPKYQNDHISNVFLNNNTPLTPQLEQVIATTEDLDTLFQPIHESSIGSQWIYLTLSSGMIRLFPWTASSSYPVDWQPQTISFYTVADQIHDPERKSVWTAPYNDFAGAGLMVTNSYPIYDGDTLIGVMSNDFLIKDLQKEVLGFKVGINGFAFLLDSKGNVIAHKNYAPENTPLGTEVNIRLVEQEPYMNTIVAEMLKGNVNTKSITDAAGKEWVVVYAPIQTTNWHLGLMQPLAEIIQPATNIASQLKYGAIILVLLALVFSIVIARWISLPVTLLSKKARLISASVDAMEASMEKGPDILAKDTDYSNIHGTKEIYGLAVVFGEMVATLQKRINELGSIYTLGQTIAATVEYEKSLDTVLSAVERTVRSDFAEIYIVQNGQWTSEITSRSGANNSPSPQKFSMPENLMAKIVLQKSSLLIKDPDQGDPSIGPDMAAHMKAKNIYSLLAAPLVTDEKPVGLVSLENYGKRRFTEDDQRQLNRLAALASIAINNAIQVRQREQALKEQIRELKIEIDQNKMQKEVSQIIESDYFQSLQKRASEIRARSKSPKGEEK
jgi:hypothetical protein